MRNCTCGYDGICLMTECELLNRMPKDPRATWGELIAYFEALRYWS